MQVKEGKPPFAPPTPRPVFEDPSGRRLGRTLSIIALILIGLAVWSADFIYRVVTMPAPAADTVRILAAQDRHTDWTSSDVTDVVLRADADTDCRQGIMGVLDITSDIHAYVPYGDETALSGLRAHCAELGSVFYEALTFNARGDTLSEVQLGSAKFPLTDFQSGWKARNRPVAYPVIKLVEGVTTAELAETWLSPDMPANLAFDLGMIDFTGVDGGICLDLSDHADMPAEAIIPVMTALRGFAAPVGLATCIVAEPDADFWSSPELAEVVDGAIVLTFTKPVSPLTPTSLQQWSGDALRGFQASPFAERAVYGYETATTAWKSASRIAEKVPFAEAMLRTSLLEAEISFNADLGAAFSRYVDGDRLLNSVWIQDAATFRNKRAQVQQGGAILWPIGYEDDAIWPLLQGTASSDEAAIEAPLDFADHATVAGNGPFSKLVEDDVIGARSVDFDPVTNRLTAQDLTVAPRPHRLQFFGDIGVPALVSVSFNGLGTPDSMDQLLTILADRRVPATFFVAPHDVLLATDQITKLSAAGHSIGLTTVPRTANSWFSTNFALLRNNLAQFILSHRYGIRPLLIRNPARFGQLPGDSAVLSQLIEAQADGFLPVYASLPAPYGELDPDAFVERLRVESLARNVNVMSFDFSAGNERFLMEALPLILQDAQFEGYRFQSLPELAGLPGDAVVPASQLTPVPRDAITFRVMQFGWLGIQNLIWLLALIVALRYPTYIILALLRRRSGDADPDYRPPVTIIVPAYNEEEVIERTVGSILAADYPGLRLIVVDDGSTDRTAEIVRTQFGDEDRLTLVRSENHGKWHAIDLGLMHAKTEFIVIVDADTLLAKNALGILMQPFKDPEVGAVAGTVEIGNRGGILTAFQTIEYMHAQQVVRRGYETFGGILVVSGAIGAYRVEAIKKAGWVTGDTITEDADLTLAVHRAGYRIVYREWAKSYTEAPATPRAFIRQRLRWNFGLFQVSWKHKRAVIDGLPVGFISLVDAVWYSLVTSLIYPMLDLVLLVAVVQWLYSFATEGAAIFTGFPLKAAAAYGALVGVDMINLTAALLFARRFEPALYLAVPLQRLGYQQMLYVASLNAIWSALAGRQTHWNKLKRFNTSVMQH